MSADNNQDQQRPIMTEPDISPPNNEVALEATAYGVYKHNLPLDSEASPDPALIMTAIGWDSANEAMRTHAAGIINESSGWGGTTKQSATHNIYEIINSKGIVKLRYSIEIVCSTNIDDEGATIWTRQEVPSSAEPAIAPPV